jgi:hypothetical protein
MNSTRYSRILPVALLVSVAVWTAAAADSHDGSGPVSTGAAYAVTFHVNAPSTVPDGATVACKASIAPRLSAFEKLTGKTLAAESSPVFATVVGSSADCTVQMPGAFAATKPGKDAVLSYEIDAYTSAGPVFVRTQHDIPVAHPSAGATANLHLDVSL